MQLNEVNKTLGLLRNNRNEGTHTMKFFLIKYGGVPIAIWLKDYFQQILQSKDIPTK